MAARPALQRLAERGMLRKIVVEPEAGWELLEYGKATTVGRHKETRRTLVL
jgi:hypothetical protein